MDVGKVPVNALKRSVLRQLNKKADERILIKGAGIGEDCAVVAAGADGVYTCMQQGAIGTDATRMTVSRLIERCANNLAAGGASLNAILLGLTVPVGTEEPRIRELMTEAAKACEKAGAVLAGGQTNISEGVAEAFVCVTGIGRAFAETKAVRKAKAGDYIVLSKWIGLEGTALLAKEYREVILTRYPAYLVREAEGFADLMSVVPEAATAVKSGVCAMHDASEGGILGCLWELAEKTGTGLEIHLKKIPLRQETVEVCEFCNVNPYELLSGGCLAMIAEDGDALVKALNEQGIPAAVIGTLTDGNDRLIINDDEVRYMDRQKQDAYFHREKQA